MATPDQIEAALRRADAAGDANAARILAAELRRVRGAAPAGGGGLTTEQREAIDADMRRMADPTAGQSFGTNLLQGTGRGMTSVLRAVGGGKLAALMGLPATQEEAARVDAPLLDTAGGAIGNVVGQAAPALAAVPFTPAALPGAVAAGAATGAALTEGDAGDRIMGAIGGGAGTAAARAVMPAARAVRGAWRGLTEPLTTAGRDRIAGRTIERFSTQGDALDQLVNARAAAAPTVTGARPSLAEATRDPGLARLARTVGTLEPEAAAALAARQAENNAARVATLQAVAGEGAPPVQSTVGALRRIQQGPTRAQAEGTRSAAARAGYGEAFEAGIDPRAAEMMAPQIAALMERPSMQAAMANARALAAEEGLALTDGTSVQGLHYAKQALDDLIEQAVRAGDNNRARLLTQTARDLSSTLDELSPAYQAARAEFRANSVPINRQDVAARLAERGTTAVRDLSGNPRLRANQFASMLNDEARLIEQATGSRAAGNTLDDLLTPTQAGRIQAVRDELELLANLDSAAAGPGSHTAQMLASQNLVRQVAGPMGQRFPTLVDGVVSEAVQAIPHYAGLRFADRAINARLGEAMLDPDAAAALVRGARTFDAAAAPRAPTQLDLLLQRMTPAAAGYLSGQAASQ